MHNNRIEQIEKGASAPGKCNVELVYAGITRRNWINCWGLRGRRKAIWSGPKIICGSTVGNNEIQGVPQA